MNTFECCVRPRCPRAIPISPTAPRNLVLALETCDAYPHLELTGGGIRGIFQAVYLREIETQLSKPVRECFDLVAGTSTGAIIGLGVALGVDLNKIVQLFEFSGSSIFPPTIRKSANRTISTCAGDLVMIPSHYAEISSRCFRQMEQDSCKLRIAALPWSSQRPTWIDIR